VQRKYIIIFMIALFLIGCESELDKLKRENSMLKKEVAKLENENHQLKNMLERAIKIYHIDMSDLKEPHQRCSGDVFRQVFDE